MSKAVLESSFSTEYKVSKTLNSTVCIEGVGLHTGCFSQLSLKSEDKLEGIWFKRLDLPQQPMIKACVDNVTQTCRSTCIGEGVESINTIEHLMAAFYACNITNVMVEIKGSEVPILDGSSQPFIELIQDAGTRTLDKKIKIRKLKYPVIFEQEKTTLIALPYEDALKVTYVLDYPKKPFVETQYVEFTLTERAFIEELAFCRTFCFYEELEYLREKSLIKGGSLDCAIIIKGNEILNSDGLRTEKEISKHKILDLIGDLSLMECPFHAHIIAIRSGHTSHLGLAKKILHQFHTLERF